MKNILFRTPGFNVPKYLTWENMFTYLFVYIWFDFNWWLFVGRKDKKSLDDSEFSIAERLEYDEVI